MVFLANCASWDTSRALLARRICPPSPGSQASLLLQKERKGYNQLEVDGVGERKSHSAQSLLAEAVCLKAWVRYITTGIFGPENPSCRSPESRQSGAPLCLASEVHQLQKWSQACLAPRQSCLASLGEAPARTRVPSPPEHSQGRWLMSVSIFSWTSSAPGNQVHTGVSGARGGPEVDAGVSTV